MVRLSIMQRTRASLIADLRERPELDALVVGAGVNGVGTYRDLALQGLRVAVVDKGDFCAGASAAPSRMIHGGLRYLENGEFQLVRESVLERNRLLRNAPHYVGPLPTTIPIFDYLSGTFGAAGRFLGLSSKPSKRGAMIIKLGLSLYDAYTGSDRAMPKHRFDGRQQTRQRWPDFPSAVACSATYYDAWITYPERLCLEMVLDVERLSHQAYALNYVSLELPAPEEPAPLDPTQSDQRHAGGRRPVLLRDTLTNEAVLVRPKVIVNATGAWIDATNRALRKTNGQPTPSVEQTKLIGGTKGSHLLIRNQRLVDALGDHMVYYENHDRRICIVFAYHGNALVGTTDLKVESPDGVRCTPAEVEYILDSLSFVFPEIEVKPTEVVYTFSGVRPLPQSDSLTTGQISRDHECRLMTPAEGFDVPVLCLVGGKWTTFRSFSEQVTDQVLELLGEKRKCSTDELPIGGGRDFPARDDRSVWITSVARATGVTPDRCELLLQRYGSVAREVAESLATDGATPLKSLPEYCRGEIEYLATAEKVQRLSDVVFRRTSLAISGRISLTAIDELADVVGDKLGWPAERVAEERADVVQQLGESHGVSLEQLRGRGGSVSAL